MATKKTTKASKTDALSPKGDSEFSKRYEQALKDGTFRTLYGGTFVLLPGSGTLLRLQSDVLVSGDHIEKDAKFVGMLARDQNNWDLNIDQIEGTWNPVTCRREDSTAAEE